MSAGDLSKRVRNLIGSLEGWSRRVLQAASTLIGAEATQNYMRDAGAGAGPRLRVDQGPLRRVSGRLAQSLRLGAQEGIEEIHTVGPGKFEIRKGTTVEYAALHEEGGVRRVTDRQRSFFWYKHATTGQAIWRAMALSDQLRYPARPYLQPGTQAAVPKIEKRARDLLSETIDQYLD